MTSLPAEMGAYHEEHLRELASKPNTTVFRAERHGEHHEPWASARLRAVLSRLVERVLAFPEGTPDVTVQIKCLKTEDGVGRDEEMCAFYRDHPKTYHMLTCQSLMRDPKSRTVVLAMLDVRQRQESGEVGTEQEADALATRQVMAAMGVDLSGAPPPAA